MARILIIDDDKSFREALADSIRGFGHAAAEASGPEQALELISGADAIISRPQNAGKVRNRFPARSEADCPLSSCSRPLPTVLIPSRRSSLAHSIISRKPIGRSDLAAGARRSSKKPAGRFQAMNRHPSSDDLIGFSHGHARGAEKDRHRRQLARLQC